jgi:hypothetical protein
LPGVFASAVVANWTGRSTAASADALNAMKAKRTRSARQIVLNTITSLHAFLLFNVGVDALQRISFRGSAPRMRCKVQQEAGIRWQVDA